MPSSRSGTRSRWTSTPAPPRAISASADASPAAPQSWSDSTSPPSTSSSEASISFLPVNGSPICTEGPLLVRPFPELLAREHGGAADPVAAGGRAVEDDRVAGPLRTRAGDSLRGQQPDAHRVDEAVARVRRVEDRLAADRRDAHAVPVVADSRHRAPEAPARVAEAKAVQQGHRPRAHRDDVAQDPAHACRRSLERLDRRGVVVRLDLERNRLAVAEVDHARVLSRPLEHALAGARQPAKERRRVLVAAVLRPEEREDGKLEVVRVALQQFADSRVLAIGETERAVERLFGDPRQRVESNRGGGWVGDR